MNIGQARIRNLIIKIAHAVIEDGLDINMKFEDVDVSKNLFFKKSDISNFKEIIFDNGLISDDIKEKITLYIEQYQRNLSCKEEEKFSNLYFELDNYFKEHNSNQEKFQKNLKAANELAIKLHWKYLPVYLEQFMVNNGFIPEENPEEFYNHFHAIEDLYRYIFTENKISWKSIDGDINLDKKMTFKVYTTRWGHYDHYNIKRTMNGWHVEHISINGESDKNGEGTLFENLHHDSVCFPEEGVKYAFEILWNEADTTSMSIETLQNKLNEIALWIEQVEKVTHQYQPDWCGYY